MLNEMIKQLKEGEVEPLFIEHPCYLESEVKQDEKIWEYINKLTDDERNYKL